MLTREKLSKLAIFYRSLLIGHNEAIIPNWNNYLATFATGAFAASPELRAYAAATITSADIADNTIQFIDIRTHRSRQLTWREMQLQAAR